MSGASWAQGRNEILDEANFQFPDPKGWEVGFNVGPVLPFGIEGMRDKYPWWGVNVSHPGRIFSAFEYQFYHSRAKGVIFYQTSISGRVDFQAYDYLTGFFKLGVDLNNYRRKRTILRTFEFRPLVGGHVAFGNYVSISESLLFRTDFKFNFNPGSFLYVGVGLSYRFGSSDDNQETPN